MNTVITVSSSMQGMDCCYAPYAVQYTYWKRVIAEKKNLKSQSAYSFECGFRDDLLPEAGLCAIRAGKAYLGYFQRILKIGFHRSVRILDELAENGVIGKGPISGCRDILMTEDEFKNLLKRKGINL